MDLVLSHIRRWRVVTIIILGFVASTGNTVLLWFISLQNPTAEQSAFATAVVLAVVPALFSWTGTKANDFDKNSLNKQKPGYPL